MKRLLVTKPDEAVPMSASIQQQQPSEKEQDQEWTATTTTTTTTIIATSSSENSITAKYKRTTTRYVESLSSNSQVFKHILYENHLDAPPISVPINKKQRPSSLWRLPVDLRKIKIVSFDLDDTLWDCDSVISKAEASLQQFLAQKGHHRVVEHITQPQVKVYQNKVYSMHPTQSYDVSFVRRQVLRLAAEACEIEDHESFVEEAFQHFYHARTFHVSEHLFPGAVEAVARLRRLGLRIGTITNGNADVTKVPELGPLVEHHVNPMMAGAAKPALGIFECLRSKFKNIQPDEILHVGDSYESDVRGALRAGMSACWVNVHGEPVPEEDEDKAILTIRHVEDLADMFEAALLDVS